MRHVIATLSILAFLAGASQAMATNSGMFPLGDGDMAKGEDIFKNGIGDVPACVACHGEDGTGNDDLSTPRLSGQFFTFLIKQLDDFANDKRMDTTMFVMNNNAKGLSVQDRRDVATYLAAKTSHFEGSDLNALKEQGIEVGLPYKGKALVEYGSPERNDGFPKELGSKGPGAAACKSCHGFAGRGAPPMFPMIGQQRYTYIVNQLKNLRDGSRTNDPLGQMQVIARKLSDADINDAAAYLTGANPISVGNSRNIYDRSAH